MTRATVDAVRESWTTILLWQVIVVIVGIQAGNLVWLFTLGIAIPWTLTRLWKLRRSQWR